MNGSGSTWYELRIDTSQLENDAKKASSLIKSIGDTVESEGARIDGIIKRLSSRTNSLGIDTTQLEKDSKKASDLISSIGDIKASGKTSTDRSLRIDTTEFEKDAKKTSNIIQSVGDTVDSESTRISNITKRLVTGVASLGVGVGAGSLIKEIANVTGEFQQLGIAFETMLGSKEKANSLMAQMVDTAAKTPFDLTGVANGAKQLLAYGTASEKVNDTLIRLGNIASGLSIPLNDLVYLYGTTQVQGRLFTQDVRQFMGRGIPLVQQLSKELGKTEEQINEMVTAGKIGFPEVQRVIETMTNEGGMFFNLMEKQSASITGQIANLEDAWDMMLNDIGSKSEGVFTSAISITSTLIENYETIGEILLGLVATYSAYKAAVITLSVVENVRNTIIMAQATSTVSLSAIQATQTAVVLRLSQAYNALNKTMLANPYVLATMAAVALTYTLWSLHDATTIQEKAQNRLNEITEEAKKKKEDLSNETSNLIGVINSETKTVFDQLAAYQKLKGLYPNLLKNIDMQTFKSKSQTEQQKMLNQAINEMEVADLTSQINKDKQALIELNKEIEKVSKQNNVLTQGGSSASLDKLKSQKQILESNLKSLENQANETERLRKEAELMALPEEERNKKLKEQLDSLRNQENELSKVISNSKNLGTPFEQFDIILQNNLKKLQSINEQIFGINNQLSTNPDVQNKSYWDKQKKDAEEIRDSIGSDQLQKLRKGVTSGIDLEIVDKYKKAIKDISEADKNLKPYDFSAKGTSSSVENTAQKRLDSQKWLIDKQRELDNQQIAFALDLQQKLLDIDEDSFEKIQKQNELNFRKERLSISNFELLKKKEQEEAAKQIYTSKNGTDKGFNYETFDKDKLPEGLKPGDIKAQVEALTSTAQKVWENADKLALKSDKERIKDLLSQYQDYNAKRIAAETQYQESITKLQKEKEKDPTNEGIDAAIIQAKKNLRNELSNISLNEFQDSIDWSVIFGNLDKVTTSELEKFRKQLKDYLSIAGESLNPQDMKTVTDAFENLNNTIADRKPIQELNESYKSYKDAIDEVIEAKEKLKGLEEGTPEYVKATNQLTAAETKRRTALTNMSASANNLGQKGSELVNSGNEIISMLADFGIEVDESVSKTLAGVGQVMSGLQNIDLTKPFSIVTSSISMLTGVGKTVAGVFGIFGKDENRYQKMKEQYDALNKVWDELISKKEEYISISYGEEARKAGEEALKLTEKQIESNRTLGKSYMNSFKNKTGSSWGVRQQSRIDSNDWLDLKAWKEKNNISNQLYQSATTGRMEGLFDLSAKQLQSLKEEAPTLWAKLEDQTKEYLNNIIEGGDKLEDINKSLQEQWTQISFDSLFDEFIDVLGDMDSSSQTFADKFEGYLQKAILTSMVGEKYKKKLQQWYDNFADANSDGNIDLDEYTKLQSEYNSIVEDALKERDKIKDLMNWESTDSREATAKGVATASQDSINELNGRFTVIQSHTFNINENVKILRDNSAATLRHLAGIENNTNITNQRLGSLETVVISVRDGLDFINQHGIILKK